MQEQVPQFSSRTQRELEIARQIWTHLLQDPTLLERVIMSGSQWSLPGTVEALDVQYPVQPMVDHYTCIAVDGSQIYPDKHQGSSCFLLNMGIVILRYTTGPSYVSLSSIPSLHLDTVEDEALSADLVNCMRGERELQLGLEYLSSPNNTRGLPSLFLCDGSLIFWHLESSAQEIKERFLRSAVTTLHQFYLQKLPIMGYISLPKAKDLTNFLRTTLDKELLPQFSSRLTIDSLVDTDIVAFFLQPWHRTAIFESRAPITASYPPESRPFFLYLNVVDEIIRLEMPAWIAHDDTLLNQLLSLIVDQCNKGRGYPVALAEAHEQAVIKGPDRAFFYQLLHQIATKYNQQLTPSAKLTKKRFAVV